APMNSSIRKEWSKRPFIGGTDARIIMGRDEAALIRLWKGKRGELEPRDASENLITGLGEATADLNRTCDERNTGRRVGDVRRWVKHSAIFWMGADLHGVIQGIEAVFEPKFVVAASFSEEAVAKQFMPELQHNMWITRLHSTVLSVLTGDGYWV